jgi:hypothetical protein
MWRQPSEFVEVFELAAPGKDFEVYAENRFKRKKSSRRLFGLDGAGSSLS